MNSRKWLYWNCLGSVSPRLRCAMTGQRISAQTSTPTTSEAITDQVQKSRIRSACGVTPSGQPKRSTLPAEQPETVSVTSTARPARAASRTAGVRLLLPTARPSSRLLDLGREPSREAQATPRRGRRVRASHTWASRALDTRGCAGDVCGLLGLVCPSESEASASRDAVAHAMRCQRHRGPDETGTWAGDEVVFGFNRLSIIDVDHSHQPLHWSPEGVQERYTLLFNGEIYNYLELRQELIDQHGATMRTHGDGEVIVALYHYLGQAAVSKLR